MSENWENKSKLLLSGDDHEVPQKFAKDFDRSAWNLADVKYDEDFQILEAGPYHEDYDDAWQVVLDSAYYVDRKGHNWRLYQDGSLFMVRQDMTDEDWKEWGVI